MLASISQSTMKQYDSTYRLWHNFCSKNSIPLYDATSKDVILFLQDITDKNNYKYGTINSHRSALSLILSSDLGSDPFVKRFLKGMSRLRPSQPRYDSTWDPLALLNYIENMSTDLNLKQISQKLATLLALITGARLQTISLIRLANIENKLHEISILITDRIKTSGVNKLQPTLHIPFFTEKPSLCVASTLLDYICKTKELRNTNDDFLFISCKKPHNRANKQTISRWVRECLKKAGIDTNKFKPHSTRHSSTSAALRQGVSLETICRTAGWSEKTGTFAKFYNRPLVDKSEFAKAILALNND